MTATPARVAALGVLRSVRGGGLADRALARAMAGLEARDRAWLQELVYGTLRLRGRLDHILAGHVRRGLEGLEPDVLDVLRLGAYQLTEMGGVPP
ncbi:MAG: transcription antitermination factor NusB, partial [Gemmatimonadota bacterium]